MQNENVLLLLFLFVLLCLTAFGMRSPTLRAFLGFADDEVIAFGPWYRPGNEEQIVGFANLDNFEILNRASHLTHMAGHFHAAHDCSREQALTDSAGTAVPTLGSVRGIAASKCVATDDAFKSAAFGKADSIDVIAGREQCRADDIAGFNFFGEVSEFFDRLDGDTVEFFDVAEERLGEPMLLLVIKAELHGVIAVTLLCFALQNAIRAGEDNGDVYNHTFGIVNPGLP
jgi:hypothetical protein